MGGGSPAQPSQMLGRNCKKGCSLGQGAAETDGQSAELSSGPGFLPAFPPLSCALDPDSEMPMKWHGSSKCRCFERGLLLLQCFSQ